MRNYAAISSSVYTKQKVSSLLFRSALLPLVNDQLTSDWKQERRIEEFLQLCGAVLPNIVVLRLKADDATFQRFEISSFVSIDFCQATRRFFYDNGLGVENHVFVVHLDA